MDTTKIGQRLRQLRTNRQLTQAQLAEIVGVSNRSISRWENGSSLPDLSILLWLSEFYEVEISSIIKRHEQEEIPMDQQQKETIQDIVAYSHEEKEIIRKMFFILFTLGIILMIISTVLYKMFPTPTPWIEFIIGMGHGFSFGLLFLGAIITSGKIDQIIHWIQKSTK